MRSVRGTARRRPCYGSIETNTRAALSAGPFCGGNHVATQQAAVPRRPCRQHSAHRADQGGARQAREGRDHGRATERGRGRRNHQDHQEAGRHRAEARHRRRVPPRLVAFRFHRRARRYRCRRKRPRHPVPGRADQAACPQDLRQDRFLQPPDDRAFQVPESAHQGDAEDDHPVPGHGAFSARAQCGEQGRLCQSRRYLRRSGDDLSEGDQGILRRRLPLSAARRHCLGLPVLAGGTEEGARARRRRRSSAGHLRGLHQQGAGGQASRHDHHVAHLPRQFPLDLDFVGRL